MPRLRGFDISDEVLLAFHKTSPPITTVEQLLAANPSSLAVEVGRKEGVSRGQIDHLKIFSSFDVLPFLQSNFLLFCHAVTVSHRRWRRCCGTWWRPKLLNRFLSPNF